MFEAIAVCFQKMFVIHGRARPSEFWYFALFVALANIPLLVLPLLGWVFLLLWLLWHLASLTALSTACIRRLHDIGRSGWWLVGFSGLQALSIAVILWLFRKLLTPFFQMDRGELAMMELQMRLAQLEELNRQASQNQSFNYLEYANNINAQSLFAQLLGEQDMTHALQVSNLIQLLNLILTIVAIIWLATPSNPGNNASGPHPDDADDD